MHKRSIFRFFHCLIMVIVLSVSFTATTQADPNAGAKEKMQTKEYAGKYCGVSCLYGAMELLDKSISYKDLLKTEYVGSRKGSSLAELKQAAEDFGLYAIPLANLTKNTLMELELPIILHVKSDTNSKEYGHYELFLGFKNNKITLFDPPKSIKSVAFYEFVSRWNGNGLIVSDEPIDLGTILAPARKRFLMWLTAAIGVILVLRWAKRRWLKGAGELARRKIFGLSIAQTAGFVVIALLCGMVYHFANDEGFLAHANATSSVQQAHIANFIPKISRKKVVRLLNSDTVIIDARLARDFDTGHIEGAINVPVDICDKGVSAAMSAIDKNARIVVYCQSAGCSFALEITKKLKDNGFSDISIFKGGWNEWKAKKKNK